MKEAKRPNSRRNLDIAIDRLCASAGDEPGRVKRLLATAIYMLGSLAGSLIGEFLRNRMYRPRRTVR